jgi:chromosome segregation ATPase
MADEQLTIVEKMDAAIRTAEEKIAVLEADLKTAADAAVAVQAEAAEAKKSLETAQAELAGAKERIGVLEAERAALAESKGKAEADAAAALELASKAEGRAKLAEGVLARDPDALRLVQLAGTKPIDGLDAQGGGEGGAGSLQAQWAAAVAACGGDYVKARKVHADLFAKLVPGTK